MNKEKMMEMFNQVLNREYDPEGDRFENPFVTIFYQIMEECMIMDLPLDEDIALHFIDQIELRIEDFCDYLGNRKQSEELRFYRILFECNSFLDEGERFKNYFDTDAVSPERAIDKLTGHYENIDYSTIRVIEMTQ